MAQTVQPQVFINYISQRKKIIVSKSNSPTQLIIKTDGNLNEVYNFQIIDGSQRIVQLDTQARYQIYGTLTDAKNIQHVLVFTNSFSITNNVLTFVINTFTSQYQKYIKGSNPVKINISIVKRKGEYSSMVLRDIALAYERPDIGGIPTQIVYEDVFTTVVPLSTAFGAGNLITLTETINDQGESREIVTFAFGTNLSTSYDNQFVVGYNNTPDATKAFIVANSGNIFTVDYEGNIEAGDLNVGAISATSVTINGEPVEYLMDDKLEATSGWVNDTFETKTAATESFNALEQEIDDLSTASDNKFELKTDATDKFNTLTGQTDYLSGQINLTNEAVGQLNSAMNEKASKNDLEALSTQVEAITVPTKVSQLQNDVPYISSIPTSYVQQSDLDVYAKTSAVAADYATKAEATYTGTGSVVVENNVISLTGELGKTYTGASGIIIDENNVIGISASYLSSDTVIPSKTSDLTNDSEYITSGQVDQKIATAIETIPSTVYEAGFGLELQDSNKFVLTAGVADLNGYEDLATKEYVISSIPTAVITKVSQLQNDVGFITEVASVSSVYNILSGINIDITQDAEGIITLSAATGGGGGGTEYSAGTGIDITSNTISVDGDWLTGEITTQVTSTYVGNLGFATSGQAETIATNVLTAASGNIVNTASGAITSEYIEGLGFVKTDTTYTAGTGLELDGTEFKLTAEIPSNNDISGIASAVASTYVGELDIPTTVEDLSDGSLYAKSTDVTTEIATATGVVTGWVEGKQYLTEIPASVSGDAITAANAYTDTVSTALNGKFGDYVTTATLTSDYYNKTVTDQKFAQLSDIPVLSSSISSLVLAGSNINISVNDQTGAITISGTPEGSQGTTYYAGEGLALSTINNQETFVLTGTVLSGSETISIAANTISLVSASNYILSGANISKLTNDAGYLSSITVSTEEPIQGEDATNQIDYPATSIFLNYDSFQIREIEDNIISISWKGMYVGEYLCQSITIGEGLGFDGGTISLTAAIPTGLASWDAATNSGYIRNQGFALTSDIPTSAEITGFAKDYVDSLDLANTYAAKSVEGDVTALKAVSGDFASASGNYYTKSEINTATGAIDGRLTALENAGYATSAQVSSIVTGFGYITGYEAGTGIDIQDGIISCTVQGGSDLSTVFDMLSAGDNVTLSKNESTGVTTINATGGGGGGTVNLIAGNRIRLTPVGNPVSTRIDVLDYTINASNQTFNFDWRLANPNSITSSLVFEYEGNKQVDVSFDPAQLPTGIEFTSPSTFTATSGVGVANGTSVFTTTIITEDAVEAVISTTFNLKGAAVATISAEATTITWDFGSSTEFTSAFAFDYSGTLNSTLSADVTNLPLGVSWQLDKENERIIFTGTDSTVKQNGNFAPTIKLIADDTVETTLSNLTFTVENLETDKPLWFEYLGTDSQYDKNAEIKLINNGSTKSVQIKYSINNEAWTDYTIGTALTVPKGQKIKFKNLADNGFSEGWNKDYRFSGAVGQFLSGGRWKVGGNINAMLNFLDPASALPSGAFYSLFRGSDSDSTSWLLDASALDLPAQVLGPQCYANIFLGQRYLTAAPAITACTTFAAQCLNNAFKQCRRLETVPAINTFIEPTGSNWNYTFGGLFEECNALTGSFHFQAQSLPSAQSFAYNMLMSSKIAKFEVDFTEWNSWSSYSATADWMDGMPTSGVFIKPKELPYEISNSKIRTGWTVVNKDGGKMYICNSDNSNGAEVASVDDDGTIHYA